MNIIFLIKPKCDTAYLCKNDSVRQGLEKMRFHQYTALPVIDENGMYCGTVTEGDFLRYILNQRLENGTLSCDIRSTEHDKVSILIRNEFNPSVNIYATMQDLLKRVMEQNFVPVIDDRGVFVGIITRKDIINYFTTQFPNPQTTQ